MPPVHRYMKRRSYIIQNKRNARISEGGSTRQLLGRLWTRHNSNVSGQSQHLLIGRSGSLKKMWRKVAFEINRLLLLSILDIFGKVETNFPSESYPPGFKYSPQTPRILKENQMISFFDLCVFSSLEIFILPIIQASSQLYICGFFVIGQWKKSSRKNLIIKKHLEEIWFSLKYIEI